MTNNFIVIIKSSAAELEWIMPFLLANKDDSSLVVIFESIKAYRSLEENNELFTVWEKNFSKKSIFPFKLSKAYKVIDKYSDYVIFSNKKFTITLNWLITRLGFSFFFSKTLDQIKEFFDVTEKVVIFKDYNGNSSLSKFLKKQYKESKLVFFPHSNHIFTDELTEQEESKIAEISKESLIVCNPCDVDPFLKTLNVKNFKVVGYTFLDKAWLNEINRVSDISKGRVLESSKPKALLISRSIHPLFLSKQDHDNYMDIILNSFNQIGGATLFIKAHPREKISKSELEKYNMNFPKVKVLQTNSHLLTISSKVDFVISFWSSGMLQSLFFNKPIIEVGQPRDIGEGSVYDDEGNITSIYRKLGLAAPANSTEEFISLSNLAINEPNHRLWEDQRKAFKKYCYVIKDSTEAILSFVEN